MPSSEFHGCAIKWRRQRRATGARWSVTSFTSASTVRICPRCKTGAGPHKPYDKRWTTFISTCAELQVVVAQVQTLPGRARCEHRQGASSQLKNLIRLRHFDASVNKMCRKLLHGVFFAMDKECTFRAGLLLPRQQLRLVGMSGETINGVDASPNWNIFAKNVHLLGAVDNTARESPNRCVADEHDARIRATEIVLEVVADEAAGTHARAGHDDGSAMDVVYRNGCGGLSREMQSR